VAVGLEVEGREQLGPRAMVRLADCCGEKSGVSPRVARAPDLYRGVGVAARVPSRTAWWTGSKVGGASKSQALNLRMISRGSAQSVSASSFQASDDCACLVTGWPPRPTPRVRRDGVGRPSQPDGEAQVID